MIWRLFALFLLDLTPDQTLLETDWEYNGIHINLLSFVAPTPFEGLSLLFSNNRPKACFFPINDMYRDGPMRQGQFWYPR